MTLAPGEATGGPDNRHPTSDQWLFVVSGDGDATVEGDRVALAAGDLLLIAAGEGHEIRAAEGAPPSPVANEGPPVVSLDADQVSGEATFTAAFRASASDPDGNPLTFAWSVDGVVEPSVTGATASVTFEEAGTYVVAVRVSDGV